MTFSGRPTSGCCCAALLMSTMDMIGSLGVGASSAFEGTRRTGSSSIGGECEAGGNGDDWLCPPGKVLSGMRKWGSAGAKIDILFVLIDMSPAEICSTGPAAPDGSAATSLRLELSATILDIVRGFCKRVQTHWQLDRAR